MISVIRAFAVYMDMLVIRSEQNGDAPKYPYGTYKVTDINREKPHLVVIEIKPKTGDDTKCIVTYRGQCDLPISLSFLHSDGKALWSLVYKACDWWDDFASEICAPLGITVTRLSDPQDRTVQLDTDWEYRFGFDVKLSAYVTREREVDAVDIQNIAQQILLQE